MYADVMVADLLKKILIYLLSGSLVSTFTAKNWDSTKEGNGLITSARYDFSSQQLCFIDSKDRFTPTTHSISNSVSNTQGASNVSNVLILKENCVFSAAVNLSPLSVGSWRLLGREFQVIGPTTENV